MQFYNRGLICRMNISPNIFRNMFFRLVAISVTRYFKLFAGLSLFVDLDGLPDIFLPSIHINSSFLALFLCVVFFLSVGNYRLAILPHEAPQKCCLPYVLLAGGYRNIRLHLKEYKQFNISFQLIIHEEMEPIHLSVRGFENCRIILC